MIIQVYYKLVFYYKHVLPCIDKSMQIILERDSIDKPLTFNVCLLQLIFHTVCSTITYSCKGVFNHQIPPRVCTLVLFIIVSNKPV